MCWNLMQNISLSVKQSHKGNNNTLQIKRMALCEV